MSLTLLTNGVDITQGNLSETKVFNAILTSKARLDTKRFTPWGVYQDLL